MSVSQKASTTMQEETEIHGVELVASDNHDEKHTAIDGVWLTTGEIEEIYTVITEGDVDRRESYTLEELSSLEFWHNYDGTYTLGNGVTLGVDEWKDVCEYFLGEFVPNSRTVEKCSENISNMGQFDDEDEYINDLHEYLENSESVVSWESYGHYIAVDILTAGAYFDAKEFDVNLRSVDGPAIEDADAFVSIDGPDVTEIIEEQ